MNSMYSRLTLLAILQQAEYDLDIWETWLRQKRSSRSKQKLQSLRPEKWTVKLKIIDHLSRWYALFVSLPTAIQLAVKTISPIEKMAVRLVVWSAAQKLRRLQKRGLTVIGVAGSYGKTSVKHLLKHTLSQQWFTLATPASYNTPLGIALTILKQLTAEHNIFIAELGEYQPGDINNLLSWIRPDIGLLTPIGFAHSERFGSSQKMVATLAEMVTSRWAPPQLLVDDANWGKIPDDSQIVWYGRSSRSSFSVSNVKLSQQGSTGWLNLAGKKQKIATRLWGNHQLRNALPGIIVTHKLGGQRDQALAGLQYAPDIPRRLALTYNANGSILIDNSYNSNPGSWQEMFALLQTLQLPHLAIITSGFVELEATQRVLAHHKLAEDLAQIAQAVVIIKTRDNETLCQELPKKLNTVLVVDSFTQALTALQTLSEPVSYLWLEGGSRELYV